MQNLLKATWKKRLPKLSGCAREALQDVLNACDAGYMVERGTGGMTVGAQMRRSFYDGVPAWLIEEARASLGEKE
jgi:hypothetical protein